jgi:hypothetical protein
MGARRASGSGGSDEEKRAQGRARQSAAVTPLAEQSLGVGRTGRRRTDMQRELNPVVLMETGTAVVLLLLEPIPGICCITPAARATGVARGCTTTARRSGAR